MNKPSNYLILSLIVVLLISGSCSKDCRDGFFTINEIKIEPRRWFPETNIGETEPWDNSKELPIIVLTMEMQLTKFFRTLPEFGNGCFGKYLIENPVKDIRVFSNLSFNGVSSGSDLSSILLFSPRANTRVGEFISKEELLRFYVNESNFTKVYFYFNQNPELQGVHRIRMEFVFEDGTIMESNPVDVLLVPARPAQN
ncbi:hypothetical protein [Cecembia rubra]|uniref:Lipoprotein n=1 Tax=Cecembia rubra TaxID=1485585 RepID=A0A2P8DTG3_9BACT|nr:hypothetical protein [Cecembia rubra]PSL00504.1 hypothetical protein CLV48_11556 [Cecembia rubra]